MYQNEEIEIENEAEFRENLRVLNAVRKRYYARARLKNNEFKKVRKWLDNGDTITIGTDTNKNLSLLNMTRMDSTPKLFPTGR